jgi:tRNA dimethylallyltransferase
MSSYVSVSDNALQLAVDLATRFNGEIINGDAMQMYQGLPIITNKIPLQERNGILHHLIDFVGLEEEPWRISKFKKESLRLIKDIHSRGKLPILVGGTHYYLHWVLFNDVLVEEDSMNGEGRLDAQYDDDTERSATTEDWSILDAPVEVMLDKLREVDPIMAARWHPNETRKIRRSLQIYLKSGKRASEIYAEQHRQRQVNIGNNVDDREIPDANHGKLRYKTLILWPHTEREALHSRLNERVETMVDQGLISEAQSMSEYVKATEQSGNKVDVTRGVWISIGFKEMEPYFAAQRAGVSTEADLRALKQSCIESVKTSTRQYSAKQLKWIRNKLWNSLSETNATDRLYVFDSSNIDEWAKHVTVPSEDIVHAFLRNGRLPDPKSLSTLAKNTLGGFEHQKRPTTSSGEQPPAVALKQMTCDLCKKTMTGHEQWEIHIHSSHHKRALKSVARRAQRDEYHRNRVLTKGSVDEVTQE